MFFELIETLSADDIKEMAKRGVPAPRVSEWKAKKRLPTRPQATALAEVKGIDLDMLNRELTVLEAEHDAERNPALYTLVKTAKAMCLHS